MLQSYGFHALPTQVPASAALPVLSDVQAVSHMSDAVLWCLIACTSVCVCCMCVRQSCGTQSR